MDRRSFFKVLSTGGLGLALSPVVKAAENSKILVNNEAPATNIADALAIPRTIGSMPGKYPGKVIKTNHNTCVVDGKPVEETVYGMLRSGILALTGAATIETAWQQFVTPDDIIGLKVNPIAGKLLSTSHAVTRSVIKQLKEAGIPEKNIIIWDRREADLRESGYTAENYPGIQITSTEYQDKDGSYFNKEGKLYSEERIDKDHFFYADTEEEYDAYTMPFMVNGGKYSYFTRICTRQITKIINMPVLKNAGATTTLCLKNLAFGSITNTARLHGKLWHETCAYACAFPPLRDKLVLNIVDGLIGCFDGGPAANPQFICQYNTLLIATDPVATDRIGHEIIVAKRIEEGIQSEDKPNSHKFVRLAQELKLGVGDREKIELIEINCQ